MRADTLESPGVTPDAPHGAPQSAMDGAAGRHADPLAQPGRDRGIAALPAETEAVVFQGDGTAALKRLALKPMANGEVAIDVLWSGVSTGTERMFWSGEMPPFPGMAYPLVPGYEAVGRVRAAPGRPDLEGRMAFIPGAHCYEDASALFGASAAHLVAPLERITLLGDDAGAEHTLLALAATAQHALTRGGAPDLIIGHGVLGRLAARLCLANGWAAPTVWEINPDRCDGAGYDVLAPGDDPRRDYGAILDLSGAEDVIDLALGRARKGGVITLAGFYKDRPSFNFPAAFMKEASLHIAAEWTPADLRHVTDAIDAGRLSLDGLITHTAPSTEVEAAYSTAFNDPSCLKLIIDWKGSQ